MSGGFTDGKVGTGASGNEALLFNRGCVDDKPKGDKPKGDSTQQPNDNQTAPQTGGRHK